MKIFTGKLLQCLTFKTLKQRHHMKYNIYGKTFVVLSKIAKMLKFSPVSLSPFTVSG